MKTASVTELKAHLSRYLRMVKRGGEVQVLERGVPVARLLPIASGAPQDEDERRERLIRSGVVRAGTGDVSWLLDRPPNALAGADVSGALDEDREDRV